MRRRQRWRRLSLAPVMVLAMAVSVFWLVEFKLQATINAFAEAEASWTVNEVIHHAVLENVVTETGYQDLIHVEKDTQGKITLMQANLPRVNRVASEATLAIQDALRELPRKELRFPLGQVFGSKLFAAYGPAVKLVLIPVGTVQVVPYDDFEGAGINQTRHRIFLKVDGTVSVVVPLTRTKVKIESRVPIADTVIVGQVPDFLMGGFGLPWQGAEGVKP